MTDTERSYDVVIVGAGLTGLVAARTCQQEKKRVLVLEARDRVGGRTLTERQDFKGSPSWFDLGARFIGKHPYQFDLEHLVTVLGLELVPQYQGPGTPHSDPTEPHWGGLGANLLSLTSAAHEGAAAPDVRAYVGSVLPQDVSGRFYLKYLSDLIDNFPIHNPACAENGEILDTLSVQDWVDQINLPGYGKPSVEFRALLRVLCRVGFSEEPEKISMLWFLFYIASSGGLERFQSVRWPSEGSQGWRVSTGAQSIADKLRADLDATAAGTVRTAHVVKKIQNTRDGVKVITDKGVFLGSKALVALSPSLYGDATRFMFEPPLPESRVNAARAMETPRMILAYATFKSHFWRKDSTTYRQGTVNGEPTDDIARYGLSGDVLFTDGPVVWMMDATSSVDQPALFAFIVGDSAVALTKASKAERKVKILAEMTSVFGHAVQDQLVEYYDKDWGDDEFAKGGPAAHFAKGTFFKYGREILLAGTAKPHGNVYFASTESAMVSNGYMAGAVWSGQVVAADICKVSPEQKLHRASPVAREQSMLWCIQTILRAIKEQDPFLEFPALTDEIAFYGPGGTTLLRGPYKGKYATIEFYKMLAQHVTMHNVDIESYTVDVEKNIGFATLSVSGVINRNGNPFHNIKTTMAFEFNDKESEQVLIKRDWMFLNVRDLDMMHAAQIGPFSPKAAKHAVEEIERRASAIANLDLARVVDSPFRIYVSGEKGRASLLDALELAPRDARMPTSQLVGLAGLRRITEILGKLKPDVLGGKLDRDAMIYYSWQKLDNQPLLVTVSFENSAEPVVSTVDFKQ